MSIVTSKTVSQMPTQLSEKTERPEEMNQDEQERQKEEEEKKKEEKGGHQMGEQKYRQFPWDKAPSKWQNVVVTWMVISRSISGQFMLASDHGSQPNHQPIQWLESPSKPLLTNTCSRYCSYC